MEGYRRLVMEEREEISRLLAQEVGIREIGRTIGRNAGTISREVRRGGLDRWRYRALQADRRARRNASKRRLGKRTLFLHQKLANAVHAKLLLKWSPEQIAKWLKREYDDATMHVAAETIYTYVYVLPRGELKAELLRSLRRAHKFRRRRGRKAKEPTVAIEDMLSIEERPAEVADRIVPGHWEGDLIVGGRREQSVLGTLVERTTRTVLLVPLKTKRADEVRRAFAREMKRLPQQMRLSLTYDQGREMAQHKLFTKQTKMKVYFAHPRSPWERGTNENTNGLIRQFFPKGTNFRQVSRREIKHVQHLLNGRPRAVLDFRTPYEAMQEVLR
jgi:transposase, IS30 family